jgi:hypothetical protein
MVYRVEGLFGGRQTVSGPGMGASLSFEGRTEMLSKNYSNLSNETLGALTVDS